MRFRLGGNFNPPPQNEPLKSPPRLGFNVLKNLESAFTGIYLNYSDKPSESEESIAERTKLRTQRSDEIAKKENMIDSELFRKYFKYSSLSDIYQNLNKAIGLIE